MYMGMNNDYKHHTVVTIDVAYQFFQTFVAQNKYRHLDKGQYSASEIEY